MSQNDNKPLGIYQLLELVLKGTTILIAFIYLGGFVIVTLHNSQFGIAEFDLIKPRIIAAGSLFLILMLIPAIAASRMFALFGLTTTSEFRISANAQNQKYLNAAMAFNFIPVCLYLLTSLSKFLIKTPIQEPKPLGMNLVLSLTAIYVVITFLLKKKFNAYPKILTLLVFAISIGFAVVGIMFWDHIILWMGVWYYLVGLGWVVLYHILRSSEMRRSIAWEQFLLTIPFILLTLFCYKIYGNVKNNFGGGAAVEAVFHFSGKNPISELESAEVFLLEETAHGYYFQFPGNTKESCFIRRDLVSAINFGKKKASP